MKIKQLVSILMVSLFLAACSAHNPLIVKNMTTTKQISSNTYQAHSNQVYVTSEALPKTIQYETLAKLDVGKVWYGSSEKVYRTLADHARKLGADIVIEVKTWHQPAGWSWAAPHGSGIAVKIIESSNINYSDFEGSWK